MAKLDACAARQPRGLLPIIGSVTAGGVSEAATPPKAIHADTARSYYSQNRWQDESEKFVEFVFLSSIPN